MQEANGTTQAGTPQALAKLADGASAEVYAWPDNQVLKLFRSGFHRESIERELHHSRKAHALGIPTPRPEKLVHLDGRIGIVFARCDGPSFYELIASQARPAKELADLFFDLQQAIHRCSAPELAPLTGALARRIALARDVPEAAKEAALATLEASGDAGTLCHGDFHPLNVMLSGGRAMAIDWLDAARGDPGLDVVRTLLFLQYSRPGAVDPAFRAAFLQAYLRRCREAWSGRIDALERWGLPVAIARLASVTDETERRSLLAFVASLA
jgi:thiamine kinase